MPDFLIQQAEAPRLYVAGWGAADLGWLGFVLPASATPPGPGIATLSGAFPAPELAGSFFFSAEEPTADAEVVYQALVLLLELTRPQVGRALVWITGIDACIAYYTSDPPPVRALSDGTVQVAGLSADGGTIFPGLTAVLVPNALGLQIQSNTTLTLPPHSTEIELGGPAMQFVLGSAPVTNTITEAAIQFAGPMRGCLTFDVAIQRSSLSGTLRWGFQTVIPALGKDDPCHVADHAKPSGGATSAAYVPAYFSLADGLTPSPGDWIGFHVAFDPSDAYNDIAVAGQPVAAPPAIRTAFGFTGKNVDGSATVLAADFRTNFGHRMQLNPAGTSGGDSIPAMLTIALSTMGPGGPLFILTPHGDFSVTVTGGGDHADLLCGLSGTETIAFTTGDTFRFISGKPAYAVSYPWPEQSPVSAPPKSDALLDSTFRSSWATIIAARSLAGVHYSSQPKGSTLYGLADAHSPAHEQANTEFLWFKEPGVAIPPSDTNVFPLLPFGGVVAGDGDTGQCACQIEVVEARAVATKRRVQIGKATRKPDGTSTTSASKMFTLQGAPEAASSYKATTPTGLIVQVESDGTYDWALLGQNGGPTGTQMKFVQPSAELHQALQTSNLFLVAADPTQLGASTGYPKSCPDTATDPAFCNWMNIEEWAIEADVPATPPYDNYSNVMIIKGRRGKLPDLVANPDLWTQKEQFSIPNKDASQLVVLSLWLQRYLREARQVHADNPFFAKFLQIIDDENWTGILILKADIVAVPDQLVGLLGGIDMSRFNAHHFGIDIAKVDGATIEIPDSNSMFGLIYYVDPNYDPASGAKPIPPAPKADFDFKVLTLQVLFENTAVKDFQSLAQLTMNKLFDEPVTRMGDPNNIYNSIVLSGALQHQGGKTTYSLDTVDDNTFYFDSNVLHKVEIVKAQFATVSDTPATEDECGTGGPGPFGNNVLSQFELWGFIDFQVVFGQPSGGGGADVGRTKPATLDVFSFGNELDASGTALQDLPRKGLRFSGLAIDQRFNDKCPALRRMRFDASKIAFDLTQSTPRPASFVTNMALQLQGFIDGTGDHPPKDRGLLSVITGDFRLSGVGSSADVPWYGLEFRLDMGSPGALAGKAGLASSVTLAWSPGNAADSYNYNAVVGLKLPGTGGGAKLISIESVMKLSIGGLTLCFDANEDDPSKSAFVLRLTDIALKFLGLLKLPPNGSTSFYLFGGPDSGGKPSKLGWYAAYNQATKKKPDKKPDKKTEDVT